MKNRERLLNTNQYDLLIRMQNNLEKGMEIYCILDIITGKLKQCNGMECEECIQQWLNEEEHGGSEIWK